MQGVVTDARSGHPIPYVNLYFSRGSLGTITDKTGSFYLSSDKPQTRLRVSFQGYETQTIVLTPGDHLNMKIALEHKQQQLRTLQVFVPRKRRRRKRKRKKEDPAYQLLQKIWAKKKQNGLSLYDQYRYDQYEKLEIDLNNVDSSLMKRKFFKGMYFVFNNLDTSRITGKAFLPIFIDESLSKVYGKNRPTKSKKTVLLANKASGFEDNQAVIQRTKNLYRPYSIYGNHIQLFNKSFVSPLSRAGWATYNYYITDTIQSGGYRRFKMNYFPKNSHTLSFKGAFWVQDRTYAITDISMQTTADLNVNFVKRIYIDQTYDVVNDSVFLLSRDYVVADLSFASKDKHAKGVYFKRTRRFTNYKFDEKKPDAFFVQKKRNVYDSAAYHRSDEFWTRNRPEPLNEHEAGIYEMFVRLKKNPKFQRLDKLFTAITSGYYRVKPWGLDFGNLYNFLSGNDVEGTRLALGVRSFHSQQDAFRTYAYLAYGLRDRHFKYGLSARWLLDQRSRLILGAGHSHDIVQLGNQFMKRPRGLRTANLIYSGLNDKLSWVNSTYATLEIEPRYQLTLSTKAVFRTVKSASKSFVIDYEDPVSGRLKDRLTDAHLAFALQFTPGRKNIGYGVERHYINRYFPTFMLRFTLGLKGVLNSDLNYRKIQFYYDQALLIGPLGKLVSIFQAGKTYGAVPLSLLDIPTGNQAYWIRPEAFNLLDYYEFVTDQYVALYLEQHFNGRIFSHIPGLNKLNLRSLIFLRSLWGSVSQANIDINRSNVPYRALSGHAYYEYGFGVENIGLGNWRIFRVDFNWRGNYRQNRPDRNKFFVKLGIRPTF